ncbi:YdaU family protein [Comamonas sp.]|uniref:YdaU family protein n=1 Tax=Comamonas sp. TaxID=34028 RepID=UPI0025827D1C|nr:YdaU family protein [Comamonas sp.]
MNHYPHHIGDFNSATMHLTFVERALYRELLDLYYDTERPLIGDAAKLARRVRATSDELRQALDIVLEEFFIKRDDGWHNERCDIEIASYHQKQEQQRRAGQASAKARGSKSAKAPRHGTGASGGATDDKRSGNGGGTDDEQAFNDRSTNQNQNQNHQKETSSPKDGDGEAGVQRDRLPDDAVPSSDAQWSVLFGDEFGVEVDPTSVQDRKKFFPLAKAWVAANVSIGQMRAAVIKARVEAKEGIAYLPAYVDRVLVSMQQPAAAAESFVERAARERMHELAPLAAAQAPQAIASVVDGYAFFAGQEKPPAVIEVQA